MESKGCAARSLKDFAIWLRKASVCGCFEDEDEVGAGAELAGAGEDAVDEFLGELLGAFGEGAGKEDDRIDAGHLEIDGFACVFGGALEMKAGVAAAGEADGADAGIADELEAVFIADVVDQLHGGEGKARCFEGLESLFGEQARGVWVERVGLGDDGIAGGDGCGEISAADAVEGEGKVVGPEDDDGADGGEAGADVFLEIERGVAPGLFAYCRGGLTKLVGSAGEFDVLEARGDGKGGLFGCGCDDGGCGGFDVGCVGFEEGGDLCWVDGAEFGCGFGCGGEGGVAVGPSAGGEGERKRFSFCGVLGVEGSLGVGFAPFAVDQYLSCDLSWDRSCDLNCIHWCSLSSDCCVVSRIAIRLSSLACRCLRL